MPEGKAKTPVKAKVYAITPGEVDLETDVGLLEVKFLGHVISSKGVAVDLAKIVAVTEQQRPTNAHEIRSFLGLIGYYRRFLEGLSKLSSLLSALTKKNVKYVWSEECEKSFQELKRRLTMALVLALLEPHKLYMVYNDASKMGL
ncbi:uncharacterized mitochondrial protein AtMg00860-like [Juglans microcarpa x Juglans regia]|uniref:uncharacterized mitochondrial protein AtMg00860-like n=1 Tax=Juglans microcarpa x Juglans regia TaxID=2249226 RepID=UPI001B7D9B1E|nr:uncharacterized mitochondrial protein AtMg00860-like [Juglans microcarpa x Juglans regia]